MKYIVIFEKVGDETVVSISLPDRKIKAKICTIYDKSFIVNEKVIVDNPEKAEFYYNNFLKGE